MRCSTVSKSARSAVGPLLGVGQQRGSKLLLNSYARKRACLAQSLALFKVHNKIISAPEPDGALLKILKHSVTSDFTTSIEKGLSLHYANAIGCQGS